MTHTPPRQLLLFAVAGVIDAAGERMTA